MKVSFFNIGCKVNFAEISTIQEQFKNANYEIVDFDQIADIVVIHSCTVTTQADADCRKAIRKAQRLNPMAFVAVLGCYAQINPNEIAEIEGVDIILGNEEKFRMLDIIDDFSKKTKPQIITNGLANSPFYPATSIDNEVHTRIALKIQDGCDYYCTYCAVAHSRGPSRSMEFNELMQSIIQLNNNNALEIVLSGINIGEYKSSNGENFSDVVTMIDKLSINSRIRISSIEPNLLTDSILSTVANSKVFCPHFHIPLQSGSNIILKKMNRRYTVESFTNLIEQIHQNKKDAAIGIDVICGFPGETEELFQETYELLNKIEFSYLHVFTYSDRKIAKASQFVDKIPNLIKKQRTNALRELSVKKTSDFYTKCVGNRYTIIPEKFFPEKKYLTAWTENYIKVHINIDKDLPKQFYNIKIISNEGMYCIAEFD